MDTRSARNRARQKVRNAGGSPENPSVPLDPDAWEERGWMASRNDSGVRMTHANAIGHPPIMRAINLVARSVAKLPSSVYRLGANPDDAVIERSHPAHRLISRKVNDAIRAYTWKQTMLYHALLRGNGYSAIIRQGLDPIALVLLDPIKTEPFVSASGEVFYATEAGGVKRKIPAADVFHIKGLSFDGLVGHDILTVVANALAMGPAARKWMSKLLSRGSTAGGLLMLPRELSPDARKKRTEEFDKYQAGLDNAFKTMALEDGAKWIRTMITPQEAAIFDVLRLDTRMVANVFGLPPHKLGDDSKAAYNSLEQENKSLLEDGFDPWCVEFETEASEKLLTEEQNATGSHAIYIDRTALQMGDTQSQANAYGKLTNDGLMLPDEARARMNLPPLPDGQGKLLRIPVNIAVDGVIAGQAPAGTGTAPTKSQETKATKGTKTTSNKRRSKPTAPNEASPVVNVADLQTAAKALIVDRLTRLEKIKADQLPKATNKGPEAVTDFWRNHRDRLADALAPILPIVAMANGLSTSARTAEQIAASIDEGTVEEQAQAVISFVSSQPAN